MPKTDNSERPNMGKCVIFNLEYFDNSRSQRKGTATNGLLVAKTFGKILNFRVQYYFDKPTPDKDDNLSEISPLNERNFKKEHLTRIRMHEIIEKGR